MSYVYSILVHSHSCPSKRTQKGNIARIHEKTNNQFEDINLKTTSISLKNFFVLLQ